MNQAPRDLVEVRQTFRNHYEEHLKRQGLEVDQALGAEKSLASQYAGRVPFELLQNALDRCHKEILIDVSEERLVVANDANPITIDPEYAFTRRSKDRKLSDFHALCSNYTSNKSASEDYGNKGVGFRSVFSASSRVQVWSRTVGGEWWGLELHLPLTGTSWRQRREAPEVARGLIELMDLSNNLSLPGANEETYPSYYFPIPLLAESPPVHLENGTAAWQTLVVVPLEADKARERIFDAMKALDAAHLDFVRLRQKSRTVQVRIRKSLLTRGALAPDGIGAPPSQEQLLGASRGVVAAWTSRDEGLLTMAGKADLNLDSEVTMAVRWPPVRVNEPRSRSVLYCHLPTEVHSMFGCDVHADFQLGIDRKHLELKKAEAAGNYNRTVLGRALDLHLVLVLRSLDIDPRGFPATPWDVTPDEVRVVGDVSVREDLWEFLDPGSDGYRRLQPEQDERVRLFIGVIQRRLFKDLSRADGWTRWARIAARFFTEDSKFPLETYAAFWNATQNWIGTCWANVACESARKAGERCLEALRAARACVIPRTLQASPGTAEDPEAERSLFAGFRPPEILAQGDPGSGERVYVVRGAGPRELGTVLLPISIRERGRELTGWGFHPSFVGSDNLLRGAREFNLENLFGELRQLPRSFSNLALDPLAADPVVAVARQHELIRFAARLFLLKERSGQDDVSYQDEPWCPGWRVLWTAKGRRGVGRAISTLFLPVKNGRWAPARQCLEKDLDLQWLQDLAASVPDLDLRRFLLFLGVCTWRQELLLVEGGEHGLVNPVEVPPTLQEAGGGRLASGWGLRIPLHQAAGLHSVDEGVLETVDNQPGLLAAVRAAWKEGWLDDLAHFEETQARQGEDSKRESDSNCVVFEGLGDRSWYPVGEGSAIPPEGLVVAPRQVRPSGLTFRSATYNPLEQVLWGVLTDEEQEVSLLRALGCRTLEERTDDPTHAASLLKQLRETFGDLGELGQNAGARAGLIPLFQRAIKTLVQKDPEKWDPELPLLAYSPLGLGAGAAMGFRPLCWCRSDDVWVTNESDLEDVKRMFPEECLLVAPIGRDNVKKTPLEGRYIALRSEIGYERKVENSPIVRTLRTTFDALLPSLLAVAQTSKRYPNPVDVQDVVGRWARTQFLHVTDVWRIWQLDGHPTAKPKAPEKGTYNDVMFDGDFDPRKTTKVIGGRILFDVDPLVKGAVPPLTYFARVLSLALLDGRVQTDWYAAIAEYEIDPKKQVRLKEFLSREGADAYLPEFERLLKPLSVEESMHLAGKLEAALRTVGVRLKDPSIAVGCGLLGLEDLEEFAPGLVEEQVNAALDAVPWTEKERPFVPVFVCRHVHRDTWNAFSTENQRRDRVLLLAFAERYPGDEPLAVQVLRGGDLASELNAIAHRHMGRLDFSPLRLLEEFLGEHMPPEPLDEHLPEVVTYAPIISIEEDPALEPIQVQPFPVTKAELTPQSDGARGQEQAYKAQRGGDAEKRALEYISHRVLSLMADHEDAVWDALMLALPENGKTWRRFDAARRGEGDLRELLHVSSYWGSAGFDILGAELVHGVVQPVRYEVKGLGMSAGRIQVHLSRNEIGVARSVMRHALDMQGRFRSGRWVLLGVTPSGIAHNLSAALNCLFDGENEILSPLARKGFRPDGIELTVSIPEVK